MLPDCPPELLCMILDNLENNDLWTLYNTSNSLRPYVAQKLFRSTAIRFDSTFPERLNYKRLAPSRIFDILEKWLPFIHDMEIIIRPSYFEQYNMFELLGIFPNLKTCSFHFDHFYSDIPPRIDKDLEQFAEPSLCDTYICHKVFDRRMSSSFDYLTKLYLVGMKSGFIALPKLQVLQFLSISFETEDATSDSRVAIDFLNLPRMKSIAISGWQEDNLLLHGRSQSVERLEMHDSLFDWTHFAMLANLGSKLREILVSGCDLANYYRDRLRYIRTFQPAVLRLSNSLQIDTFELDDSMGLLPLLLPATQLSLKRLIIRLGYGDRGFDLDDLQSFLNLLPSQLGSAKFAIHIGSDAFSPDGDLHEFPISCEKRFLSGGMSQQFIPSLTRLHPDAI